VRYLSDRGIRQFIDLGSGIPTAGNVHEVLGVTSSNPRKVVYVDLDPEVEVLFGDLTIVEPGVVPAPRWRPDGPTDAIPEASMLVSAGIGRKD
jgi:hypothetical protein